MPVIYRKIRVTFQVEFKISPEHTDPIGFGCDAAPASLTTSAQFSQLLSPSENVETGSTQWASTDGLGFILSAGGTLLINTVYARAFSVGHLDAAAVAAGFPMPSEAPTFNFSVAPLFGRAANDSGLYYLVPLRWYTETISQGVIKDYCFRIKNLSLSEEAVINDVSPRVSRINLRAGAGGWGGGFSQSKYAWTGRYRFYRRAPVGLIRINLRGGTNLGGSTPRYLRNFLPSNNRAIITTGTVNNPPTLNPPATIPTIKNQSTFCNPSSWLGVNAGPWLTNRPGYVCTTSPRYGNGSYAFSAAGTTRKGNVWVGPNTPRFSFDGFDANGDEVWTLTASGWAECQNPVYSDTRSKSRTANSITFNIGAGTITIGFTSCNLNTGPVGGTSSSSTPQVVCGGYTTIPTVTVLNGGNCNCSNATAILTQQGCPVVQTTKTCSTCMGATPVIYVIAPPTKTSSLPPIITLPPPGVSPTYIAPNQAPPPPPPPQSVTVREDGSIGVSQVVGPDFSRFVHGGRKLELYQPLNNGSVLHKKKRARPQELQENATMRLAGAPLVPSGDKFDFMAGSPEIITTSFTYFPRPDLDETAKKDAGKRWQAADWADFAGGTGATLLEFMQKMNILDADIPTTNGAQAIVVVGWVKYNGATQNANGENYLIAYCNGSVSSAITPIASLDNDYWVLIENDNEFLRTRIISKK